MNHKDYHENKQYSEQYLSVSQFKQFLDCEARSLAELRGEYTRPHSDALLCGNLFDAALLTPDELPELLERHSDDMLSTRGSTKGQPKKVFQDVINMADTIKQRNNVNVDCWTDGDKQCVVSGTIDGVAWRGMLDVLNVDDGRIVDVKTVRDFEPVWDERYSKRVPFYERWGYWLQAAVYQELVRQKIGETLPVFLFCVSKKATPEVRIIRMSDELRLLQELELVRREQGRILSIKRGDIEPDCCGKCDYCAVNSNVDVEEAQSVVSYTGCTDDFVAQVVGELDPSELDGEL